MAQKSKTINDILQELSKDYKSVLHKAVQKATDTACEDIYKFSISCLERYYDNYIPSSYDRTDSLWHAIVPIAEVADNGNTITSTVGVEYDAGLLDAYVASGDLYDGSAKYGKADGQWVIENYLMGIHPATDGSRTPGEAVYMPWQDTFSPHATTDKYLRLYKNKLNNNVYGYLISHVTK